MRPLPHSRRALGAVCFALMAGAGCSQDPPGSPDDPFGSFAVTAVVPNSGPATGTVQVTIRGSGFRAGAIASFGDVPVPTVVQNERAIVATVPPHPVGGVDVTVTNPGGARAVLASGYRYLNLPPVGIAAISPGSGFAGTLGSVLGNGFEPGVVVLFGGVPATLVTVTPGRLEFTIPPHSPGAVEVVVTNPDGQSATRPAGFVYVGVTLTVTPVSIAPGGELDVRWSATANRSGWDWIGLFRRGDSNFDYLNYEYIAVGTSGALLWRAPEQPGEYEFRYLPDDGYIDVSRTAPVTVTGAPAAGANLRIAPRRSGRGAR